MSDPSNKRDAQARATSDPTRRVPAAWRVAARKRMRDAKQRRTEGRQRIKAWVAARPWARPTILVALLALFGFLESTYTGTIYGTVIVALIVGVRFLWNRPRVKEWVAPRKKIVYPLVGLLTLTIAALLPYVDNWFDVPQWFGQATSGGTLSRVALFILFALGLNVVVGFAGLLDLGYVAFWAIGAYTAALLTGAGAYSQGIKAGTITFADKPVWEPWMWLILFAALAAAIFAGILLGSPTLRLRGDYLAIVTLGFGEIIRIVANNLDNITGGPRGIRGIPHPEIHLAGVNLEWGTLVDVKYYYLLLFLVVLWMTAIYMLDNSRIGRAWVAIREDEVAAAAMGVPVVRMKLTAFAIGACTAGVGGVIYAEQVNFINPPTFDILNSIFILCMVVVGGMGSIAGSVLGAAAIILIPEIFREFEDYRFFAFGVALVILMVFRPQGLLPSKRRKAELRGGVVDEQLYEAQHAEGG
jgi:branched-chain amino acid transport system permease protein